MKKVLLVTFSDNADHQDSGITMENNKTDNVEVVVFDQKRDVEFSVEDYDDSAVYTEMRFDFPELDYFCPLPARPVILPPR